MTKLTWTDADVDPTKSERLYSKSEKGPYIVYNKESSMFRMYYTVYICETDPNNVYYYVLPPLKPLTHILYRSPELAKDDCQKHYESFGRFGARVGHNPRLPETKGDL